MMVVTPNGNGCDDIGGSCVVLTEVVVVIMMVTVVVVVIASYDTSDNKKYHCQM